MKDAGLLILLAVGGYLAYNYYKKQNEPVLTTQVFPLPPVTIENATPPVIQVIAVPPGSTIPPNAIPVNVVPVKLPVTNTTPPIIATNGTYKPIVTPLPAGAYADQTPGMMPNVLRFNNLNEMAGTPYALSN